MRKQPQQQRAKQIVDAILEATQMCVAQYGVLHITTPKIAERSGVSVGSIYQYFENKEQIIEELLLRKSHTLGEQLKALVMHQNEIDIEQLIPLAIELGFVTLKADQGFFMEILKHWHLYSHSQAAQVLEQHFFEVWMFVLSHVGQNWRFDTLKHKSFVIVNSTLFTMMRFVSNNSFLVSEVQLKQELAQMILAYLKHSQFENRVFEPKKH